MNQAGSLSQATFSAAALALSTNSAKASSAGAALGQASVTHTARQALLKAPMLCELHDWTNWRLLFQQELGHLSDFVQHQGKTSTGSVSCSRLFLGWQKLQSCLCCCAKRLVVGRRAQSKGDLVLVLTAGIGLATVRKLYQLHAGVVHAIEVSSEQLVKIPQHVSSDDYSAALSQRDASGVAAALLGLVATHRGVLHTPTAMLASRTQVQPLLCHTMSVSLRTTSSNDF